MAMSEEDTYWMRQALILAEQAADSQEVPVGAVVVMNQTLIGAGHNQPISQHDPTAHAEIVAMREAAQTLGNYRLTGTTLYVTLEPCCMCAGAMVHARIQRLVYGARDPRAGAIESCVHSLDYPFLNHRVITEGGLMAAECGTLLSCFFKKKRG